jgi:hypothetical protein
VIIDCDSCEVRDLACGNCVVTFLLASPAPTVNLDAEERHAIDVLAGSGLVPPLRLVPAERRPVAAPSDRPKQDRRAVV